jgi:hypothetical protein
MSKYGVITSTSKEFHEGEPLFIIRAIDPLALMAVNIYAQLALDRGCSDAFLKSLQERADEILIWQRENPDLVKRCPD